MRELKDTVNECIRKWGVDILLIKSSSFVKCKCFNHKRNEGDTNCKICLGTGNVTTIRKVKAILDYQETRFDNSRNSIIGVIGKDRYTVYFNSTVKVDEEDMILIVGWENGKFKDIKEVYKVGECFPYRRHNGQLEATMALCTKKNQIKNKYIKYFNVLPINARNKISDGGVYICPKNS